MKTITKGFKQMNRAQRITAVVFLIAITIACLVNDWSRAIY